MKVTLSGDALNTAVGWVAKMLPARPAIPVTAGILIDAGEQLSLSVFDFVTAGAVNVPGAVVDPGRALVSGVLLARVAKVARGGEVDLVADGGGKLRVTAGSSRWNLPLLALENYPELPAVGDVLGELDGEVLRTALARVLPAVAKGNAAASLPALGGVSLAADGGVLTIAATDRYRLAVAEVAWPGEPFAQIVVPGELLGDVLGVLGAGVVLRCDQSTVTAESGAHRVSGPLSADEFPRFESLLDVTGDVVTVLPVAGLQASVERVSAVLGAVGVLRLDVTADGARLSASSEDEADAGDECSVVSHHGPDLTVGLNPGYFADALGGIGTELVVLTVPARANPPLLLRPVGSDGAPVAGYEHLVMSCKLADRS